MNTLNIMASITSTCCSAGMRLGPFDVRVNDVNGGSFQVWACRLDGAHFTNSAAIDLLLRKERLEGHGWADSNGPSPATGRLGRVVPRRPHRRTVRFQLAGCSKLSSRYPGRRRLVRYQRQRNPLAPHGRCWSDQASEYD
jgi:hypothetical protein